MERGSRKHVLDWTGKPSFLQEIASLAAPVPFEAGSGALMMPRGYEAPEEARLESFGPKWLPDHPVWEALPAWWLVHRAGANTPNWDIAIGGTVEGRSGLLLVEAKANVPELGRAGKRLDPGSSDKSRANHDRIGAAIAEANDGWHRAGVQTAISRDSHYQLANRMAFTWKLASMGIPVVLLYLGFTDDEGISDAGSPFVGGKGWDTAFADYVEGVLPAEAVGRRIDVCGTPAWLMSRSRRVLEISPVRSSSA